ncbi:MAG TPA: serine hydrolase domain-containing protein, partial [Armatimonadaceae bacterium]|nr:serine hydrolase domain-containing protein [Armatimonadaceae bacterium]
RRGLDPAPAAAVPDLRRIEAAAGAAARAQIAAGVAPGMTIAVARDGRVVFARGYGKADAESGTPAGQETVYKIGSVTKQFTAAVVLRLVEAGKFFLDDPITKFLPDYPAQGHRVTVRHLLNHTSGIKSFDLGDRDEKGERLFGRDRSYRDMVDRYGKQPFDFKPGEKFAYNNTAYYLLGEIVARVTGTPYAGYVERELLRPLGLSHTLHYADGRAIPNLAKGYDTRDGGGFTRPAYVSLRVVGAAGALCSTAGDLVRWTHLLHAGTVVSPASLRRMTAPTPLPGGESADYGYGLFVGEFAGHRKVYHGGRGLGFLSLVSHYPDDGITVAVLMNSGTDRQKRDEVERAVARAALGVTVRDLPLTAEDVARYAGAYAVPSGAKTLELRVFGDGGQLKARVGEGAATRLRYQGGHRFVQGESGDVSLAFTVENGRAERVTVDLRGQVLRGRRKP